LGNCCAVIPCITIILTPVLHLVTQDTPHHPPHPHPMHLLLMMLLQSSHLRLMLEMHQATGMLLVFMNPQSHPLLLLLLLMLCAHNVRPVLLIMQQSV